MTTTRPQRFVNTPRRAKAFTIGLFGSMLGAALLATREPPPPALGDRVAPAGWRASFAPPAGWAYQGDKLAHNNGRVSTFAPQGSNHRSVDIGRIPVLADESIEFICQQVLEDFNLLSFMGSPRQIRVTEADFGDWSGVMLEWTPELMGQIVGEHVFVVGAIAPSANPGDLREAYVIQFHSPAPVTHKDERLWGLILESIATDPEAP